jgi:2,4-dienoyl-CoA reductase-like NADH-dependent reductase (Old Yellow Enzyme family)
VGLVIVEATSSDGFGSEYTPENLRPLVQVIGKSGALAAIQIFPGKFGQDKTIPPADKSRDEIEALIAQYRRAAEVCAEAGFDGIEPHGAHGYLLNRFFSPVQNRRTDEYGGSLANRGRLALRILETVRPIADDAGMLVLYRHTPVGRGYGIDESLVLARELVKAGVDILDISPASDNAPGDRAVPFMELGVPVIAVNELDEVGRALEVLRERRASLVAVGRGLIADPDWPIKVREGRMDDIVKCTRCDLCYADLRQRVPVGCVEWD